MREIDTATRVYHQLAAFQQHLEPLASVPGHRGAQNAIKVLSAAMRQPCSRQGLLAVMEASLGIDDLYTQALIADTEDWLGLEAPHELEHHLLYRLRREYHPSSDIPALLAGARHPDGCLLFDDRYGLAAVNRGRCTVLTVVPADNDTATPTAITDHAYSEAGLGHAVLCAIRRDSLGAPLNTLQAGCVRDLPYIADYLRELETHEEQLCLWRTAGAFESLAPAFG